MDFIKDKEIKKLKKKLDEKHFNPENIVVGYQYRPPLEVVRKDEMIFNRVKEDKFIENMLNSYMFIYNSRLEITKGDFNNFKNSIFELVSSYNRQPEYATCVLKIIAEAFTDPKKKLYNINDLIANIPVLSQDGYPIEDLLNVQESLSDIIGDKIIDLDSHRQK